MFLYRVIKLYPKGYNATCSTWLSLFLHLAEGEIMKTGEEIYMQCDVRILDPFGCNHVTRKRKLTFFLPSYLLILLYALWYYIHQRLHFFLLLQLMIISRTKVGVALNLCRWLNLRMLIWTNKTLWKQRSNLMLFLPPNTHEDLQHTI